MDDKGKMLSPELTQWIPHAMSDEELDGLHKTQDDLIDEIQEIADRWYARRHKTVAALFELGASHNGGPPMSAEAWTRWCEGAAQRWSDDTADQVRLAVAIAKSCGNVALLSAAGAEMQKGKPPTAKRTAR